MIHKEINEVLALAIDGIVDTLRQAVDEHGESEHVIMWLNRESDKFEEEAYSYRNG